MTNADSRSWPKQRNAPQGSRCANICAAVTFAAFSTSRAYSISILQETGSARLRDIASASSRNRMKQNASSRVLERFRTRPSSCCAAINISFRAAPQRMHSSRELRNLLHPIASLHHSRAAARGPKGNICADRGNEVRLAALTQLPVSRISQSFPHSAAEKIAQ